MVQKKTVWLGFLLWVVFGFALGAFAHEGKWEKVSDEDGIEVFKKEIPGSPLIALKGQGVIHAPIGKVAQILLDTSRARDWVDRLENVKLLRKISDRDFVQYNHFAMPIVMKDRDFVILNQVEVDPGEKSLMVKMKSTEDPLAPVTDYVRGEVIQSSFTIKSIDQDHKTYIVTEMHIDPKGDVAKWVVNLFQKSWPRNTIEALRKQSAKPDVQENIHFRKMILGQSKS